MVEKDN